VSWLIYGRFSNAHTPRLTQFKTYENSKNEKNWNNKFVWMCTEFFLAEMKAQWKEYDGRILLGNNTGGGRSASMVLGSVFQLDFLVCAYTVDHVSTRFQLAQNSISAVPSGTLLLRKSWRVCTNLGDKKCYVRDNLIYCTQYLSGRWTLYQISSWLWWSNPGGSSGPAV
jgi:hypothetical protein